MFVGVSVLSKWLSLTPETKDICVEMEDLGKAMRWPRDVCVEAKGLERRWDRKEKACNSGRRTT